MFATIYVNGFYSQCVGSATLNFRTSVFITHRKHIDKITIFANLTGMSRWTKETKTMAKKKKKKYTGIDLFCGIGGFRLAMEDCGVDCVFSSDIDSFAQQTYNANFHEIPSGDITKIAAKDIPHFNILTAGFPCQPFSYAGEKKGFEDTTRGTLFFDICRILEYHKPEMVFLENVKGLVSHKNGTTLDIILTNLKKLGYFPHWKILSSLDFGLPQKRERWYCVAFRKNVPFDFPAPIGGNPKLRDIIDFTDNNPKLSLSVFTTDYYSIFYR